MTMDQWAENQARPDVVVNENFSVLAAFAVYGRRASTTTGLVVGYYGGSWGGFAIADGTFTLAASSTSYVVASRTTGAVSVSTATTNWNNAAGYARIYSFITGTTQISATSDYRTTAEGVFPFGASGGGGGGAVDWGAIGGTLADQTDLQDALDAKANDRLTVTAITPASGVANINCALGDYFTLAPSANVTSITFSNLPGAGKGLTLMLRFTQDSTARTLAWPASFKWAGGSAGAVSTASGAIDVIAMTTFDNGTSWDVSIGNAFS